MIEEQRKQIFDKLRLAYSRRRHVNFLKKDMEIKLIILEHTQSQISKGNKETQTKMCGLLQHHEAEYEKAFQEWHDAIFQASMMNLHTKFIHGRTKRSSKKRVQVADNRNNEQKELDALLTELLNTPP